MSDKLVIEFCDRPFPSEPAATVVALNGGDNPETAAEMLADFFLQVGDSPDLDWQDAGSLAARFLALQNGARDEFAENGIVSAVPVSWQPSYGTQLARVFGRKRGPAVEFVPDRYTRPEELAVARYILDRHGFEVIETPGARP